MSSYGQGGSRNWRRIRQQVLDRDDYQCQLRYDGCTGGAIEVHHLVSVAGAGLRRAATDADGCISVCRSCHDKVTAKQTAAAQRAAHALRRQRLRLPAGPHPGEP